MGRPDGVIPTAALHNALVRMLNEWNHEHVDKSPNFRAQPPHLIPDAKGDLFFNTIGEEVPAYGCVAITDGTQSTVCKHNVLTVAKPSTTFRLSYGLNLGTPSSNSQYGRCVTGGLALYDSGTPANGEAWGPKPGQFTLSKGYPGFVIKGVVDSTNKIAWVRAAPHDLFYLHGKPDGDIAKGSSGTVSIWAGEGGSEFDTTINLTCFARGAAVTSGKIVKVERLSGTWYVGPWEC